MIPRTRCVHAQNDDSQSMCTCVCVCCVQVGLTSLMLATQNGYTKIVQALLNANADPNIIENVSIVQKMVATLFINFPSLYRLLDGVHCILQPSQAISTSLNSCFSKELKWSSEIR